MESHLAEIPTPKWVSNVDRKFEETAFTREGLGKKDEVSLLQNGSLAPAVESGFAPSTPITSEVQ